MKLDSRTAGVGVSLRLHSLNWSSQADMYTSQPELQASTWVQLRERPSPYSHDEALLLCQHSETEWVVWIPQHGEMVLDRSQLGEAC